MLRALRFGMAARQRIFRILSTGNIVPFAEVEFLEGGGTLERAETAIFYEGLPPYMAFTAPSGFLGRQSAHAVSREQAFPPSLKDWNDDHSVAYLFTKGVNLPGNLVFGDIALQHELDLRKYPVGLKQERLAHYCTIAQESEYSTYGTNAGGEQPKFLWAHEGAGHVIVKFGQAGSRMADLLLLEHLALKALGNVGIPAAKTEVLVSEGFVFLEVVRFDRIGISGRLGMLSAGAVDDEFFGMRDTWPEFAERCVTAGYLARQDAQYVHVMAAFSELIGNSDRHFENLSLLIGDDGEYQGIAPAYDILPMRYACIGRGIDPDLVPIEPQIGTIGATPTVWSLAARAADEFWSSVASQDLDFPVSKAICELALQNRQVARSFVAPLLLV